EGAVAEAEDLVNGDAAVGGRLTEVDAEALLRVRHEGVRADRLARLRAADAHGGATGGGVAEVVVEGHDAVHVGPGQVELLGHDRHRGGVDVTELRLDAVQDRKQRTAFSAMGRHDGAYPVVE